jgi:hypothetical protein
MRGTRAKAIRKRLMSEWPGLVKHYGHRLAPFKNICRKYKALYMRGEL